MGTKLSDTLLEFGFLNVAGTTERLASGPQLVIRGLPNTRSYNNGILAIYDEHGWAHIILVDYLAKDAEAALEPFKLEPAGYCPHSNDGGWFARSLKRPSMVAVA